MQPVSGCKCHALILPGDDPEHNMFAFKRGNMCVSVCVCVHIMVSGASANTWTHLHVAQLNHSLFQFSM